MTRKRKPDDRPICDCSAYKFPHKIGGKCTGDAFLEFYFYNIRQCCEQCNCFRDDQTPATCDAMNGAESISEAECYIERVHYHPGEHLPINFIEY